MHDQDCGSALVGAAFELSYANPSVPALRAA